ncbi:MULTISPECIES: hypothetical protein [Acetobacter]|jgi:hypothetical protein|uniref:Uncharacterized protein n=1 Tax=Acetobacter fabarum TaxID=483199 RepID=A0A269XYC2_9PROT|nr:hypothetical protein [Acetobacter fabarum]PAK77841.1 hypothetical protein B8X00_09185 [Acetobacter fabarum]PEN28196.1 hypothetical protein CRM93_03990 [Acetobacter fabarum]
MTTPPLDGQQISLISLDRRITAMEAIFDMDRQSRTVFENNMSDRLAAMDARLADIQEQKSLRNGTLRGIVLTLSFFGSGAGTGLLLIIKALIGGAS